MRGQGNYLAAENSGYASMPHSLTSTPSYSSSSETRRPITILIKKKATAQAEDPTEDRQRTYDLAGEARTVIGDGHQRQTQQTDHAVYRNRTDRIVDLQLVESGDGKTTNRPPSAPKRVACGAEGVSGPAMIATRPARRPFSAMVRSALPNKAWPRSARRCIHRPRQDWCS